MIIIRLSGGLGNQMFQYAVAKQYQLRGVKTFLDLNDYAINNGESYRRYELPVFQTTIPEMPGIYRNYFYSAGTIWKGLRKMDLIKFQSINERSLSFDRRYLELKSNSLLTGYFQNERYFKDIESVIRKDFSFVEPISEESTQYLNSIKQYPNAAVSVHIRRGDYVSNATTNKIHGILPIAYYKQAVSFIESRISNPRYYVFSDEPEWIRAAFTEVTNNFVIVDCNKYENSWQDMYLMSRCDHHVLANSSFSWWSAWLNTNSNKITVAPKHWCSDPVLDLQTQELAPREWVRI